jgi:hypothetical protein
MEGIMPYALFSHADQISRAFSSKSEVWAHAVASGLVIELGSSEEDPPRRMLDTGYMILECAPDPDAASAQASSASEHELAQLIAACRVSPPSAAAAS